MRCERIEALQQQSAARIQIRCQMHECRSLLFGGRKQLKSAEQRKDQIKAAGQCALAKVTMDDLDIANTLLDAHRLDHCHRRFDADVVLETGALQRHCDAASGTAQFQHAPAAGKRDQSLHQISRDRSIELIVELGTGFAVGIRGMVSSSVTAALHRDLPRARLTRRVAGTLLHSVLAHVVALADFDSVVT